MEEGRIDRAIFKDYGETLVGGVDGVNSSTAYTIDLENGNAFHVILTGNCTFTFSNPTPVGSAQSFTLFLKQDATGSRTVTWPTSVQWVQGYVPTITSEKNRYDIIQFTTTNAGSTWLGFVGGTNFQEKIGLWSHGQGLFGTLGHGTSDNLSSPAQIGALTNWVHVSGSSTSAAIKNDGSLWIWGQGAYGKLGNNTVVGVSSPIQVGTDTNWMTVSVGSDHVVALRTNGTLWAWGSAATGMLGNNNVTIYRSSPIQIGVLTTWAKIEAGNDRTFAIKTDGTLWAWGKATTGSLGLNNTTNVSSPAQVGLLADWAQIKMDASACIALKTDGTIWSWGFGGGGVHGDSVNRSSPTQIGQNTNWRQVGDSCALTTDGTIWTWGTNTNGQLGQNDLVSRSSPMQVGSSTNWAQVVSGSSSTLAIKTDGTLWSWGTGLQLGHGDTVSRSSPTQVGQSTNWIMVTDGLAAFFALRYP